MFRSQKTRRSTPLLLLLLAPLLHATNAQNTQQKITWIPYTEFRKTSNEFARGGALYNYNKAAKKAKLKPKAYPRGPVPKTTSQYRIFVTAKDIKEREITYEACPCIIIGNGLYTPLKLQAYKQGYKKSKKKGIGIDVKNKYIAKPFEKIEKIKYLKDYSDWFSEAERKAIAPYFVATYKPEPNDRKHQIEKISPPKNIIEQRKQTLHNKQKKITQPQAPPKTPPHSQKIKPKNKAKPTKPTTHHTWYTNKILQGSTLLILLATITIPMIKRFTKDDDEDEDDEDEEDDDGEDDDGEDDDGEDDDEEEDYEAGYSDEENDEPIDTLDQLDTFTDA